MSLKPQFSSMHTHTTFDDGKDDIETMCRTAYEKNLLAIGFSAHVPMEKQLGKPTGWSLKEKDVQEYVTQVLAAKKRWQGKLNVFLGIEADYVKGLRSPLDSDLKTLNLDYKIGSVHHIYPDNSSELISIDGPAKEFNEMLFKFFAGDAEKLMHKYYDAIIQMIQGGCFDIIGHIDLIKMNCLGKHFWPLEAEIRRQREIVTLISKTELVVEVNTGGINRKKHNEVYPSVPFLRIIREFNVPVTITADAHCASDLNGSYNVALESLKLADIKEHVIFNGKNSGKSDWQLVKI